MGRATERQRSAQLSSSRECPVRVRAPLEEATGEMEVESLINSHCFPVVGMVINLIVRVHIVTNYKL